MAVQIHVRTEIVSLFSTEMNKDKLKLELSNFLFVFLFVSGTILYALELELILLARKVVLTIKFDLSLQRTSKGYNIQHTTGAS